jgi:hypothetical protein
MTQVIKTVCVCVCLKVISYSLSSDGIFAQVIPFLYRKVLKDATCHNQNGRHHGILRVSRYFVAGGFKSRPEDRLSLLTFSVFLLSPSRRMPI